MTESLVGEIEYEYEGRIREDMCALGMIMYMNDLREIKRGGDTITESMMCHVVTNCNYFKKLFLDHNDNIISYISLVIVHYDDDEPRRVEVVGVLLGPNYFQLLILQNQLLGNFSQNQLLPESAVEFFSEILVSDYGMSCMLKCL